MFIIIFVLVLDTFLASVTAITSVSPDPSITNDFSSIDNELTSDDFSTSSPTNTNSLPATTFSASVLTDHTTSLTDLSSVLSTNISTVEILTSTNDNYFPSSGSVTTNNEITGESFTTSNVVSNSDTAATILSTDVVSASTQATITTVDQPTTVDQSNTSSITVETSSVVALTSAVTFASALPSVAFSSQQTSADISVQTSIVASTNASLLTSQSSAFAYASSESSTSIGIVQTTVASTSVVALPTQAQTTVSSSDSNTAEVSSVAWSSDTQSTGTSAVTHPSLNTDTSALWTNTFLPDNSTADFNSTGVTSDLNETTTLFVSTQLVLNTSNVFEPFWVKTVLQIPDADFNSANFNYNMEAKLALLFNSALQKEFNSIMGRWNAARRKRAATDGAATIQLVSAQRLNPSSVTDTTLVYYFVQGYPVATTPADAPYTCSLLTYYNTQEIALILGYVVVDTCRAYVTQAPPPASLLWVIGAVIGGVVFLGLVIWLSLCMYYSCTRVPKTARMQRVLADPPPPVHTLSDISAAGDKMDKKGYTNGVHVSAPEKERPVRTQPDVAKVEDKVGQSEQLSTVPPSESRENLTDSLRLPQLRDEPELHVTFKKKKRKKRKQPKPAKRVDEEIEKPAESREEHVESVPPLQLLPNPFDIDRRRVKALSTQQERELAEQADNYAMESDESNSDLDVPNPFNATYTMSERGTIDQSTGRTSHHTSAKDMTLTNDLQEQPSSTWKRFFDDDHQPKPRLAWDPYKTTDEAHEIKTQMLIGGEFNEYEPRPSDAVLLTMPPNPFDTQPSAVMTLGSTNASVYSTIHPNATPFLPSANQDRPQSQMPNQISADRNSPTIGLNYKPYIPGSMAPVMVSEKKPTVPHDRWAARPRNYTSVYMDTRMISSEVFSETESTVSSGGGGEITDDDFARRRQSDDLNMSTSLVPSKSSLKRPTSALLPAAQTQSNNAANQKLAKKSAGARERNGGDVNSFSNGKTRPQRNDDNATRKSSARTDVANDMLKSIRNRLQEMSTDNAQA